jgi:arylsulfatase A-like enzyme
MKAVFILLDSLNRNYLPIYSNDWVKAPNIQRLAHKGIVFDNHWLGSAPCMPARRDILTGRLNFLERGWGPIEPFDIPFTRLLRNAGIRSHMETDHYHYFHVGGENYHTQFDTYAFHRGQENDCWRSSASPPAEPEHLGRWDAQYDMNQQTFLTAVDYPTPKTFTGAIDWLKCNEGADNYVLWVEGFDPHEPFDCPKDYVDQYDDDWQGPRYDWSGYDYVDEGSGEATTHLRKQYAGTLTMADEFLGRLLDELERQDIFDDTLIILTTDHGHLVGEHGATGKNRWHVWNELGNIPLVVKLPGNIHAGQRRRQLTQNIDIMPTLLGFFNVSIAHPIHGESLKDVLEKNAPVERQGALYGWFGMPLNVTDGRYTYLRAAAKDDNNPLFAHYQIPLTYSYHDLPSNIFFQEPELGQFLPYTDLPVLRSRWNMKRWSTVKDTLLFDIESDPGQQHNLAGSEIEQKYIELLEQTMKKVDAPPSQYERLGL